MMTTYQTFSSEDSRESLPSASPESLTRISGNIAALRASVKAACLRAGRDLDEVRLIAVSKTVGLPEVAAALAAGVRDFGENRSALFTEKQTAYPDANWHFIGRIQTNKLKELVGRATLIHSVASEHALAAIATRAERLELVQDILLEVNVSGEPSKDGVAPEQLPALLNAAATATAAPHVRVCGLMTMAAQGDVDQARSCFAGLRQLRDAVAADFSGASNICLGELSMGMSEDFLVAVEEGATLLRIGRSVWQ